MESCTCQNQKQNQKQNQNNYTRPKAAAPLYTKERKRETHKTLYKRKNSPKGEREKIFPITNSSSLSFVAVRTCCGDFFLYYAQQQIYRLSRSLTCCFSALLFLHTFFLSLFSLQKRVWSFFNFLCSDWKFSMREYN